MKIQYLESNSVGDLTGRVYTTRDNETGPPRIGEQVILKFGSDPKLRVYNVVIVQWIPQESKIKVWLEEMNLQ